MEIIKKDNHVSIVLIMEHKTFLTIILSFLISLVTMLSTYGCSKSQHRIVDSLTESLPIQQPTEQVTTAGDLINLGPQVFERSINGGTFVVDQNGDPWVYMVLRGSPARLLGYRVDGITTAPQINLALNGASGSWSVVQTTDGSVYVSTTNALLFKHQPGTQHVESLGSVLAGESYIWELIPGKDGEVFGATYPGAKVFRYHPSTGIQEVSNGAVKAGESYARSIAYHKASDKLYVGVGSHTGLIKLDPRTGTKTDILPPSDQGHAGFVYYLGMVEGITSGDKLLATITGTSGYNKTLFYDIDSETYIHQIGVVVAKTAIKSPVDDKIYFTNSSSLYSYDFGDNNPRLVALNKNSSALATSWLSNSELCYLTGDGKLITYNTTTNNASEFELEIPPESIGINTVAYGPDGRIWMSGYPIGSNAAYDPVTGQTEMYQGLSQSESISYFGTDIYFGVYSGSKFYQYDTTQPWEMNTNPRHLGSIPGQDRPFAYAGITDQNKMFFGTVPGYGRLGGALVEYDIHNDHLTSTEDIVEDHSIVALLYANDELYGGTSVWGGLGIQPIATEAKLFTVDPTNKIKTSEIVPVSGAKAITALLDGPDGHIWGMADGTLFIVDKISKNVVSSHELFTVSTETKSKHVWKNAALVIHPSGRIFGVAYGEFFELDPVSKTKTTISTSASNALTMDNNGYLYFHRSINLWRYIP